MDRGQAKFAPIELVIIVAIIGTLAGIALPAILRARALTKAIEARQPLVIPTSTPHFPTPNYIGVLGRLDTGDLRWITAANPRLGTPIGVHFTAVTEGLFQERMFPSLAADAIPVRAMLYGDEGLEVQPLGDTSTALALRRGKTPPDWWWRVNPTGAGRHQLTFVFDVCPEARACDRVVPKPHEIMVEATVFERVSNWSVQNGSKILWVLLGWVGARLESWAGKRWRGRKPDGTQRPAARP